MLSDWKTFKYVGTIWLYESTFSTVHFMESRYRSSISNENLVLLRSAMSIKRTLYL